MSNHDNRSTEVNLYEKSENMTIGIPKGLMYYYYAPLWISFFKELGFNVVSSDDTTTKIVSEGCEATVSEICVPIKVFNGHVINLLEKGVDYIFIPHFYRHGKEWYCPKFLGIAELTEHSVDNVKDKMVEVTYTCNSDLLDKPEDYYPICEKLPVSKKQVKQALKTAVEKQKEFRRLMSQSDFGITAPDALKNKKPKKDKYDITIAVMGYVYNIYDDYVSMGAIKKLNDMGVNVITFDMLSEDAVKKDKNYIKEPYWVFARKVYNSAKYLLKNNMIDGIIHITAFGCGPDSIIGKLMESDCEEKEKPFMTIRVDEHSGDSHIVTRLEAYVDMLKMSKKKGDKR